MTGSIDRNGNVKIISPFWMKIAAGVTIPILVALLVTGTKALFEYHKIKDDIPANKQSAKANSEAINELVSVVKELKNEVNINTGFRLEGPRVTTDDIDELNELVRDAAEDRTMLFRDFVDTQKETNSLLSGISGKLGKIEVEVEHIKGEQERTRNEIDKIKDRP